MPGGAAGVRRFYDARLQRRGAFPPPVKLVLFGPGTVHGLDDAEHHVRKAVLMGVLTPDRVSALATQASHAWAERVPQWPRRERVVLFDEAVQVLGGSVMRWAGVPEDEDLAGARARGPGGAAVLRAVRRGPAGLRPVARPVAVVLRGRGRRPAGGAAAGARRGAAGAGDDPEGRFPAEQNAAVALGAERCSSAMVGGSAASWNVRDVHLADTLDRLLEIDGGVVVREHDTHLGDARAPDMAAAGMVNVGQLAREPLHLEPAGSVEQDTWPYAVQRPVSPVARRGRRGPGWTR